MVNLLSSDGRTGFKQDHSASVSRASGITCWTSFQAGGAESLPAHEPISLVSNGVVPATDSLARGVFHLCPSFVPNLSPSHFQGRSPHFVTAAVRSYRT